MALSMRRFGPLSNGNRCTGEVMMENMPRISAELVERCPQFFCTFKRERKLKAGFWSARVRPTAQQNAFESIKAFSVNVVIGRRNNG
jgi:hypothetical protein